MKRLILFLWQLPIALPIWLLYVLPAWALGLIRFKGRRGDVIVFHARLKWFWWKALWVNWAGHSLPFACVIKPQPVAVFLRDTTAHELRHCAQWAALGPLFPVAYLLLLLRFGYGGHPLEVDARWSEMGRHEQ